MPIDPHADTVDRIRKNFQHMAKYHILGEIPTGTLDSVNTNFTLVNKTVDGIAVYLNGARLAPTTDYTVAGKVITFTTAPAPGDVLLVDYLF